jgi:hypothetical protein
MLFVFQSAPAHLEANSGGSPRGLRASGQRLNPRCQGRQGLHRTPGSQALFCHGEATRPERTGLTLAGNTAATVGGLPPRLRLERGTHRLGGRFTQGVNLRVTRSEAVRCVCGWPLVAAVSRPFWHERGTTPLARLMARRAACVAS